MNILLIYPNINAQVGFNYGVSFISGALKQQGHNTKLLNLNEKLAPVPTDEEIIDLIKSFKPGLIGFSVVTPQYHHALKVAKLIKASYDMPIVCGGIHATIVPEEVLKEDCFDYACVGEGEFSMVELVGNLEKGESTLNLPGIWAKDGGNIVQNRVRPFVDLAELPKKDYEIFDLQNMINAENGWVRLMASRGCPFRCTYCLNHQIVGIYEKETGVEDSKLNYTRRHNLDDVLAEIEFLINKYEGISTFIFDDDIFTLDINFLRGFCSKYPKISKIPFVVNAHVKVFNDERAKMLQEAGCTIVKFGLESGSERVRRDILKRPMSNKEIVDAFDIAHKYGFHTTAFLLLGLPHETKEDIMDTIELLRKVKPGRFRWSLFFPFPKTTAYNISVKGGYINFDKMKQLTNFTDETCLDFGADHNLYVSKVKKILPWYVNINDDKQVSDIFSALINMIEPLNEKQWNNMIKCITPLEKELANTLSSTNKEYYSTRYNSFTAVKSDWNG